MQPSLKQPEFFVDRGLGRKQIPDAVRASGFTVHTMFSVYGEREQEILDSEWLEMAGRNGWIVLTKDNQIRRNRSEIAAIRKHSVRVFCITNANLTGAQQTARIVTNIDRIVRVAARESPPYVYGIHEKEIKKLWP